MLIERKTLTTHLKRLHVNGLLPDIVISGKFQGAGVSIGGATEHEVFVQSAGLDKVEPLANETGVTDLQLFIAVLESIEDDQVSLTMGEKFITVSSHDREYNLITSTPRVIGTRVQEEIKDRFLALFPPSAAWHPLEHSFVDGIIKARQILKAETVTLRAAPTGSSMVVGDPRLNVGTFDLPDFKEAETYDLLLSAAAVVPVFQQLSDFTAASLCLTGRESVIGVKEGNYMWIVSPSKPAAGDRK